MVILLSSTSMGQELKLNYTSPVDGANFINPEQTIIIKTGERFKKHSSFNPYFNITGSESGNHTFKTILSDDELTLIIIPDSHFDYGESVTVIINEGIQSTTGKIITPSTITFTIKPIDNLPLLIEYYRRENNEPSNEKDSYTNSGNRRIVNDIPEDYPMQEIIHYNDTDEKYFFFTLTPRAGAPQYSNYLSITDKFGIPLFFRKMSNNSLYFHQMGNGQLAYARNNYGDPENERFFFMDSSYVLLDSVKTGNGYNMDGHDMLLLENGNYLLMSYDPQPVDMSEIILGGNPNATVVGLVIQEVDTYENVYFQWRSWDHFQITDATDDINLFSNYIDYVHGNAFEFDTDGNLLISSRHLDEITKIDYQTGDIIYRFGLRSKNNEFEIQNDVYGFSHQHDVRLLPNGNITIYDNGNLHQPQFSRALEYSINESNKTANLEWFFRNDPDNYGPSTGSYRRDDDGKHLIGWGSSWPISVTEVLADDNKSLEILLPTGVYTYRAIKEEWNTNLFKSLPKLSFGNYGGNSIPKKMILPIYNNSDHQIRINSVHLHDSIFYMEEEVPLVLFSKDTLVITLDYLPVSQGENSDRLTLNYDKFSLSGTERIARQVMLSGIWDETLPITTFIPEFGSQNIDPRAELIISFSEPVQNVDGTPINNNQVFTLFSLKEDNQWGNDISFTGSISEDAMQITIVPTQPLDELQPYLLELLPSKIMDYDNNILDYSEATYFTTGTLVYIDQSLQVEEIKYYPSPMDDFLIINLQNELKYNISIYDVSGKLVLSRPSIVGETRIETKHFTPGLYSVILVDELGTISSKKVIKK